MQRFKVNDYCEFPERINFKKWTKEGLKDNKEVDQGNDEKVATSEILILLSFK